ncbi:hypothetical protein MMC30_008669 [Trapelia coarctata]|nr:hypothetical protein [Trapelia coarctata]
MATGAQANEGFKVSKLFDVSDLTAVVTGGGGSGPRRQRVQYRPRKDHCFAWRYLSQNDLKRLANEVASKESKGIHLLVNNAGIARDDETKYTEGKPDFKSAQSISDHMWKSQPESWAETFQTNIVAQFFTTAAFLPLLAKCGDSTPGYSSSVVNIASISGVMKGSSVGQFAYAASKAGMLALPRLRSSIV